MCVQVRMYMYVCTCVYCVHACKYKHMYGVCARVRAHVCTCVHFVHAQVIEKTFGKWRGSYRVKMFFLTQPYKHQNQETMLKGVTDQRRLPSMPAPVMLTWGSGLGGPVPSVPLPSLLPTISVGLYEQVSAGGTQQPQM